MNNEEKKLSDLVRNYPNLYDQGREDYKDSTKANVSWLEIAQSMGKSEEELKQKWKNLRDKFCKAKKRAAKKGSLYRLTDDQSPLEKPIPVLYKQLAWLHDHVKHRTGTWAVDTDEVARSCNYLEKEQDKEKEEHCTLPVITTSFSLAESCPDNHKEKGFSLKRKRQSTAETDVGSAETLPILRDEDELFLLSLLPSLKRLTNKKRMEVRMKFQQVLYAAEFEG